MEYVQHPQCVPRGRAVHPWVWSMSSGAHAPHRGGFGAALRREIARDLHLHAVVVIYLAVVLAMALLLGRVEYFGPMLYGTQWFRVLLGLVLPALVVFIALRGVLADPRRPLASTLAMARRVVTPRRLAGCLLFSSITLFYGVFTSAKNLLPVLGRFDWDPWLADLDEALHGGVAPWAILHPWLGDMTRLIDWVYMDVWYMALFGFVLWVSLARQPAGSRRRLVLTMFLCWIVLGNVLAGLMLSGGPVFYGRLTGDHLRFAGLMAHIAGHADPALSVQTNQLYLWSVREADRVMLGSGISAFPSMHLSMATLIALAASAQHRLFRLPGIAFVGITLLGSVHLGWHYAIDGYASIIVTILIWWGVGAALRRGTEGRALEARPRPLIDAVPAE